MCVHTGINATDDAGKSTVYIILNFRIGRRKTMYICIWLKLGSALGLLAMTEYIGFCVLMFVLGASLLGVYMTLYVLGKQTSFYIVMFAYVTNMGLVFYPKPQLGNYKFDTKPHETHIPVLIGGELQQPV
mgnify:CR=1 FL=1